MSVRVEFATPYRKIKWILPELEMLTRYSTLEIDHSFIKYRDMHICTLQCICLEGLQNF